MKTHLLIMNGPERRDFIIEKTLDRAEPVFSSISIYQNGWVKDQNPRIAKYIVNDDWGFISFADAYMAMLELVPIGDCFLVLDSDEIPDNKLMDFIKIGEYDDSYNMWGIQYMHHSIGLDYIVHTVLDSRESFCIPRLQRNDGTISVETYFGTHQAFVHTTNRVLHTDMHIIHIKHDFAVKLSSFAHAMALPESYGITGYAAEIVKYIKQKFGLNPPFIYNNFNNKSLLREVRKELRLFDYTTLSGAIDSINALEFALSTDKQLIDLYRYEECKRGCCDYDS